MHSELRIEQELGRGLPKTALVTSQKLTLNGVKMMDFAQNEEFSETLKLPDGFYFFMNHMREQEDVSPHHHESLEIAILLAGEGIHRTTSGDRPCKAGQIFLIPPGVWHAYAGCQRLELYNCLLSRTLLDGPLAWAASDLALGPLLKIGPWQCGSRVLTRQIQGSALRNLRKLLVALFRTYSKTGVQRQGKLVSELLMILDFIALDSVVTDPVEPAVVHSAVQRAAEMLRADLAHEWTLPELARNLRINPSYLVRLFGQATGKAPMKFLAEERAHKAAQLLMITDHPLSEIGALVGWPEPKQFARSFRQHFGECASVFRRRLRQGG